MTVSPGKPVYTTTLTYNTSLMVILSILQHLLTIQDDCLQVTCLFYNTYPLYQMTIYPGKHVHLGEILGLVGLLWCFQMAGYMGQLGLACSWIPRREIEPQLLVSPSVSSEVCPHCIYH